MLQCLERPQRDTRKTRLYHHAILGARVISSGGWYDIDEETSSLTLRSVRWSTIDALYELKALTGKPICRLVDEVLTDHLEKDPSLLAAREEEVRRLANLEQIRRTLLSIGKI